MMNARWMAALLANLAGDLAREAVFTGGATARFLGDTDAHRWMHAPPQPGDLVVETSTHGWPDGHGGLDHASRFGRYLGRESVAHTDEDGETWHEEQHAIVLFDGTVFRWTNCRFARVPEIATLRNLLPWDGAILRVPTHAGFVAPETWAERIGGHAVRDPEDETRWRFMRGAQTEA